MKNFIFISLFISFMFFMIYTNDHDYKNVKRSYYDCKSETQNLIPLTPYEYNILLKSKSLENFDCIKQMYTRYYVNILKEKKKK